MVICPLYEGGEESKIQSNSPVLSVLNYVKVSMADCVSLENVINTAHL